jgi:hypothetical protein
MTERLKSAAAWVRGHGRITATDLICLIRRCNRRCAHETLGTLVSRIAGCWCLRSEAMLDKWSANSAGRQVATWVARQGDPAAGEAGTLAGLTQIRSGRSLRQAAG